MMRLPWFKYHAPMSVAEVVRILAAEGPRAMLIAGGTDLLPNMKRRQQSPATLISLRKVDGLKRVAAGSNAGTGPSGEMRLGAGLTLTEVVNTAAVRAKYLALWQGGARVAPPHPRDKGALRAARRPD